MPVAVKTSYLLILSILLNGIRLSAQFPVTQPWSTSLSVTFGNGTAPIGPPLSTGYSDFSYTPVVDVIPGTYNVVYSDNDAGHLFYGPFTMGPSSTGYKMLLYYNAASSGKTLYRDTLHNLCGSTKYLFWAGINNMYPSGCLKPELIFSVETTTGTVIATFDSGIIGGALAQDNYAWYYGYFDRTKKPKVPFYGMPVTLPPGVHDVVVKIMNKPSNAFYQCYAELEIDNIVFMPIGPDIRISSPKFLGGWIVGSCFQGNAPLVLNGKIESGYQDFGTANYILQQYNQPAYQWQESRDDGYTWTDIPGENSINISRTFGIPDTFWVRMRVSESTDIGNKNCSNVSNILQVEVDGLPKDFDLSTNSPVCTDGDLNLKVTGGVTYNTFGPNGFYDNSAFPHIYHPPLRDSGWYYSEIMSFGGCKGVDSEYVRIIGPDLKLSAGRPICYSDTLHLHASGGTLYNWTPATGLNNAHIANPVAQPLVSTTYEVRVTDDSGCSAYGKVDIPLRDSFLLADFTSPEVVCPGDVISFRDTSAGQITNWNWDFGNGNHSNLKVPPAQTFSLLNNIFLPVQLHITDTAGCTLTKKKYIRVVNNCFIAVPSAFTPNQDGLNDYLYPVNAYKATQLDFKVFNRNGQIVFHTRDMNKKWDGTVGGIPQASGVYVWMLSYNDEKGKHVYQQGTTALIR